MIKWISIAALVVVTACTLPDPVPVAAPTYVNIQVPASLTRNCYIPAPPTREVLVAAGYEAQSIVADWALEAHGALETCAARQQGLVGVVRNYQARIDELNNADQQN